MKRFVPFLGVLALGAVILAQTPPVTDWPQWRGPDRTGISKETGLLKQWPAGGPTRLWRVTISAEGMDRCPRRASASLSR
jgi:hypothetical protein